MKYAVYAIAACSVGCLVGYAAYYTWVSYFRSRRVRRQLLAYLAGVSKASTLKELEVLKTDIFLFAMREPAHHHPVLVVSVMTYLEEKINKLRNQEKTL